MLKVKSLLVVLVMFGFFGVAMATSFPGDRAGMKADYLWKKLSLTNDQYTTVYQSFHKYEIKVDEMKAKKMDKKAMTDELAKLQTGLNGEIEKAITKDQVTKWTGMKDKFWKMSYKKKVRKPKTETTESTEKKDVKKEEPKKDVKKDVKKEEPKKDVKKEEPKKDEKKK
ncbi:MAG: hypothetical protein NTV87_06705 [Ignavibacteriae bacterium]|jgi:hypothetical protein|nr:hypothetical protein [Ignavibacteriota bacterium]